MNASTIDPLTLPSLPLAERSQLPKCSGIYFVIKDGDILYVGRTANLYQRWLVHHIWQHLYGVSGELRVAWLECSDTELLPEVEKDIIVHFKPLLNKRLLVEKGESVIGKVTFPSRELREKFKAICALNGKDMNEAIIEFIQQYAEQSGYPSTVKGEDVA